MSYKDMQFEPRAAPIRASAPSDDLALFHRAMSRRKSLAEADEPEPEASNDPKPPPDNNNAPATKLSRQHTAASGSYGAGVTSARRGSSRLMRIQSEAAERCRAPEDAILETPEDADHAKEDFVVSINKHGVSRPRFRRQGVLRSLDEPPESVFAEEERLSADRITLDDQDGIRTSPSGRAPVEEQPVAVEEASTPVASRKVTSRGDTGPSSSQETEFSESVTGQEATVGSSSAMTLSHKSDSVEGIDASFGPSRPMSLDDERHDQQQSVFDSNPSSSLTADGKRRKRSVREVFRMGLFVSRRNKKRPSNPAIPTGSAGAAPSTPEPDHNQPRLLQRRVSRLEMNEPIEDIFNEVVFETMDKNVSPTVVTCDDNDVIEDPDVVVMTSMLQQQCSATDDTDVAESRRDADFMAFRGVSVENGDFNDLT